MKEINAQGKRIVIDRVTQNLFKHHGWPSVCVNEKGVVYAVCSGHRMEHVCPAGKDLMFVSFNGGETWSKPIIVQDSWLDDRDAGIVNMGGGKMLLSWFSEKDHENFARFQEYEWLDPIRKSMYKGWGETYNYMDEKDLEEGSYVSLSEDYGLTWSDRIRVPVSAPHGPNVTKDGTLIYLGRAQNGDCGEDEHRIICFASTDGGHTWEKRGVVPHPSDLVNNAVIKENNYDICDFVHEPHVVELPNGRLLGAMRVHCRPEPFDPRDTCYTTFSDDGGMTWSDPRSVDCTGLPPHLFVTSKGAVICSYGDRRDGHWAERAAVSYDFGEAWEEDYIIDDSASGGDLGYPATAELPDGSLITVYYQPMTGDWLPSFICTKWKLKDR